MSEATRLLAIIKQTAVEAVACSNPSGVYYGTVVSVAPLEIQVEQKLKLKAVQLVLTRNVTDYTITMDVEHSTEQADGHSHAYTGAKTFHVRNALQAGEQVVLVREQGGQRYMVLDRIAT